MINLRILSTSTPARRSRVEQTVFRRRTCDKRIWTKPLAFAADAGFAMGISIDFCLESLVRSGFCGKEQLWIDVSMNASPRDGLIVTKEPDSLSSAYVAGTANAPSFEHAGPPR